MKTFPGIINKVTQTLGNGSVIKHPATEENPLGESGLHTFIDDIQDVIEKIVPEAKNKPQELNRALFNLFLNRE